MKITKYIRIDETPRRLLKSFPRMLVDPAQDILNGSLGEDFIKNDFPPSLGSLKRSFSRHSFNIFNSKSNFPESDLNDFDVPSYLVEQIIRTNNLILEFNAELEQRGVLQVKIEEFQFDSFKIGLKIAEGIILQFNHPWMASRQFDLAKIHVENTIITLENFEDDKIGSNQKIIILKNNCRRLISTIKEFKKYFGLDQI